MAEALTEIPRVDLEDFEAGGVRREAFVDTVDQGFHEIGFVFVRQPDPEFSERLARMYGVFGKLFDLSEDIKRGYERADIHHERGYTPVRSETGLQCRPISEGGDGTGANMAENWFIGPEIEAGDPRTLEYPMLYPQNIWPAEVPELQVATEAVRDNLTKIGLTVMRALEPRLRQEPGYFDDILQDGISLFRPLHYPAVQPEQAGQTIGACEHTDINFVTVLPAPTRDGLWIKKRNGLVIPGKAPQNHVIAQVGDMLQYMTGGYYLSAKHKVASPIAMSADDPGRYSSAQFIHPRARTPLVVTEHLTTNPEDYPPIFSDDYLMQRLSDIGLGEVHE